MSSLLIKKLDIFIFSGFLFRKLDLQVSYNRITAYGIIWDKKRKRRLFLAKPEDGEIKLYPVHFDELIGV